MEKAAELLPGHPQVWNHLGLAWHGANQPARASEAYQRALRIDQQLPAPHFNLGMLMLEQGRTNEAIVELSSFVALQPTNSLGFSKLGVALIQARRFDDAERALNQALRLNAKDAEAHNSMGLVHLQRKRTRDAMLEFNAALQDRPAYPAALLNQAIVAQQYFGNTQMALERYRAFLETSTDPRQQGEVRLAMARLEETARAKPVEVAALPPTNKFNIPPPLVQNVRTNVPLVAEKGPAPTNAVLPAPKTNVAHVAITNKPPVEPEPIIPVQVVEVGAEPELKSTTDRAQAPTGEVRMAAARPAPMQPERPLIQPRREREPESRGGFFDKANPMRWFRSEEKPATRPTVQSSVSREIPAPAPAPKTVPPQFARFPYQKREAVPKGNRAEAEKHFVQGARAHQERRLAAAIEAYRQAVSADPSYFDAQYNLGLAAFQMKDLPLALAANEQAVHLKPQSVDARYHFAMTLRDGNYPVDAANELRELLVEAPDERRAHLALANLYAQVLDEAALAQRHYNRLLELEPNHPDASAIRQWLATRR